MLIEQSVLIIYGTSDGHTRKVAHAIGETVLAAGCTVQLKEASEALPWLKAEDYDAVLVAASVHAGGYQRCVRRWVRRNADALRGKPNAFVSVCLGVLEDKPAVRRDLDRIKEQFRRETGWSPDETFLVAGAIPYTRYSLLKKWIMRSIARRAGGGTDTSQDYEYTDWVALKEFTLRFTERVNLAKNRPLGTNYPKVVKLCPPLKQETNERPMEPRA
jgi:menaquinone-dependent protoporphyrinogen oxidase